MVFIWKDVTDVPFERGVYDRPCLASTTLLVRSSRPIDVPLTISPTGERPSRGANRPHSIKVADDVYKVARSGASYFKERHRRRRRLAVEKRTRYAILGVTQVPSMEAIRKFTPVLAVAPTVGQEQYRNSRSSSTSPSFPNM